MADAGIMAAVRLPFRVPEQAMSGGRSAIVGTGAMACLIREHAWAETPLGPIAGWSETLLAAVNLVLASPVPSSLYWGPWMVLIYNETYRQFMADRHPGALGKPGEEVWKEAWHIVGPQIEHTLRTGESFHGENFPVPIEHGGRMMDHYWNYSFSPVYDSFTDSFTASFTDSCTGKVLGVYNTSTNVTASYLAVRERDSLAQRLHQVLDSMSEGVIFIGRDWRFTYLNAGALAHSGPFQDLLGKNIWEALPGLVYEGSPNVYHYHRAMDCNEPSEFESYYPEPLNHWMHIQVRPAPDGIVLFTRDITGQKQAKLALEKAAADLAASEEELRWTISLSSQLPWMADAQGMIVKNSGDLMRLTGRSTEETLGHKWVHMMHPEDAERMQRRWKECVQTGELYDIEHRVCTATGEHYWFRSRAYPRRDEDGRVVKWYGITDDIDEQKRRAEALEQAAAALAASEEELRWTVKMSTQNPWTADAQGSVLYIDENADAGGVQKDGLLGDRWIEIIHPEDAPGMRAQWTHCVATGEVYDMEHRMRTSQGDYHWFHSRAYPRRDEAGRIIKWYGTAEDIHTRKQAEEALRTTEKLAAVGRLATSIAHEINNPLEAVTNLLYLARTSEDLASNLEYIRTAEQELHRASVITNQTLRFQRQSSGAIALDCEDLIDNCLAVFQGKLQNSAVFAEKRLRAQRSVTCFDGEIRQVFLNLVGNAIDAMQPGGGRLLIRTREATRWSTGERGVAVTVADTGTGIAPEVQQKLFAPFFTTKGLAGTGLGLWVSQGIVARHKGTLRLRSKHQPQHRRVGDPVVVGVKSGTVFTLFLPFHPDDLLD